MSSISTQTMQSFAEICFNAKKPDEISVPLTRLLCAAGISHWYAGTLVHENNLERLGWGFFGMPMGWQTQYREEDYSACDEVFLSAKASDGASLWSEIYARADAASDAPEPRALAVRAEGRHHDLYGGYIRAIHPRGEVPTAVTFGGREFDDTPAGIATLDLLAIYAHEGFRRYAQGFRVLCPYLSPRERDVLSWSAEGKSAWDISQILGIGEATIRDYQKRLRKKYNCSSITRVAVIAALNRQITTLPSLRAA